MASYVQDCRNKAFFFSLLFIEKLSPSIAPICKCREIYCSLRYCSYCCRVSADCVWTVVYTKDIQGGHSVHSDRDTVHPDHHTHHKSGHPRDLHPDRRPAILPTAKQSLTS